MICDVGSIYNFRGYSNCSRMKFQRAVEKWKEKRRARKIGSVTNCRKIKRGHASNRVTCIRFFRIPTKGTGTPIKIASRRVSRDLYTPYTCLSSEFFKRTSAASILSFFESNTCRADDAIKIMSYIAAERVNTAGIKIATKVPATLQAPFSSTGTG